MTHTYMRDTIAKARVTCPCCLRSIMTKANGQMVRHGWKETGRQGGQWGCGYQWGECLGWDKTPLETTDRDALVVVKGLTDEIKNLKAEIKRQEAGGCESYTTRISIGRLRGRSYFASEETAREKSDTIPALVAKGLEFTVEPGKYSQSFNALVTVVRGSETIDEGYGALRIASYSDLQAASVRMLTQVQQDLEGAKVAIKAAIKHHKANPSKGKVEKRKGPVMHLAAKWKGKRHTVGKCKQWAMSPPTRNATTEDPKKVTCKRCLKTLAS